MSKWVKTTCGIYLNSSYIRVFWTSRSERIKKWELKAQLEPLIESNGRESEITIYTVKTFDNKEEAVAALEAIINDLERRV